MHGCEWAICALGFWDLGCRVPRLSAHNSLTFETNRPAGHVGSLEATVHTRIAA